jgi:hypothetical protein
MKSGERTGHISFAGKPLEAGNESASSDGRSQTAGIYPLRANRCEVSVGES